MAFTITTWVSQFNLETKTPAKLHSYLHFSCPACCTLPQNVPLYGFTSATNHAECWEDTRKACKSQAVRPVIYKLFECFPNIQVVYCAGKPTERAVYRFYEITIENVCRWEENLLHFRDQVAHSHQTHEMTRQTSHSDWTSESIDEATQKFCKKGKETVIGESQED